MIKNPLDSFLPSGILLLLLAVITATPAYAYVEAHIRPQNGETTIAIGDTAIFEIWMDPHGRSLTGYEFYLTFDPTVFKPIFADTAISISDGDTTRTYLPFRIGTLIFGHWEKNNTRGDEWSDPYTYPDKNMLWGFQLDYSQHTAPSGNGRESFAHSGVAGIFELTVIGVPPTGTTTITFDNQYKIPTGGSRQTRYYPLGTAPKQEFNILGNLEILVAGVIISPSLPDTLILPGQDLNVWLGSHFSTGLVGLDSTDAIWSEDLTYPGRHYPAGASFNLFGEPGPTTRVELTNTAGVHDSLSVLIQVELTDPVTLVTYQDQQVLRAIVDNPPVFAALPAQPFTYDEDDSLQLVYSDIFTDADDGGTDISVWLEPSSPIRVNYDGGAGTIAFSADTNYFSVAPYDSARLFIADGLGVTIDSLLRFTVNSINDPPVVSFDSVSAMGDTVVIHRNTPDTLDLSLFVTDVDDTSLAWSYTDPCPDTLSVSLLEGNRLLLEADSVSPFIDINLILTATDDEGASDSDTLVVSVQPWPPDIIIVEDIRINSQDAPSYHLNLADWVIDLDTPPAAMTWSFRALDAVTGVVDLYVTFAPSTPLTGDTVNISVTQAYDAVDLLEMTVTDDAYNTDIDTTRLFIFDGDAPMIYPLPGLTIYRDTTYAGILDLDDYVADIQDDPSNINWTFTGGDSLKSFYIDLSTHEVTITTNSTFIGNLVVSLVATNSRGLKDTSDLAILVSRLNDGPPLWYAVPDEVEVVYGWTTDLFTYGEICYDETPTDQIIFTPFYNTDSLTVTIASPDSVKLTTPLEVKDETTYLYFSAEDDSGRVSYSDTITILLKDSFSPVWERIPTISLNIGETSSGLFLRDYVEDRDTDDNFLTIEVVNVNPYIDVSYDPVTTELTVTAGSRTSDSWLIITATDDRLNTGSTLAHVVVFSVADYTPPVGGLTYFFNPVADRWIHYVVAADSTTDISRFTWHYAYGTPPRDWSDHLSFVMQDTLPGAVTWIAPYHFQNEGSYVLTVAITDAANNLIDPSPSLPLSVGFSKAIGGVLASPDQQLTVTYPPALIPNGKLLIISEGSLSDSSGQTTAEIASAGVNKKAASQIPGTVYSLDTNLPEPILVTLTYHQKRDVDPYYSFYELDGEQLVKIETYTSTDGHFEAAAKLDRDIVFAPSDTPARNAPLPDAELYCYPNPFNATIQVRFLLRRPDQGRIVIYNLLGREVYTSPRQLLEPGVHAFSWHSIDKRGLPAPSGVYFIRLETDGGKIVTRKVTLLK